jgi:hypothetical protein
MTWQFSYLRALELINDRQREAESTRLAALAHANVDRRVDGRTLIARVATTLARSIRRNPAEGPDASSVATASPHADHLELSSHHS